MTNAAVAIYRMTQEIRQLKQTNAELMEALEKIARIYEDPEPTSMHELTLRAYDMRCIARAAIAKTKP